MSKKKVNPRRKPLTHADVKRAKQDAEGRALELAMAVFLTVLVDKFNGAEYIQDVWKEVNKLSEEIAEGRVSLGDLKHVLSSEYNIIVG